jgi:UTP--glucose-1-phosphate uridylyltransferase
MADIHYIRQKRPMGLGHAVLCARKHVDGDDFAVLLGDDIIIADTPCVGQLIDQFKRQQAPVIAVGEVPPVAVTRYGIVDAEVVHDRLYAVHNIVEKPSVDQAPSTLAIMGRYVFTPEIFAYIDQVQPGKNDEIQLTDAIAAHAKQHPVFAYQFRGQRFDLGNKVDWIKTNIELALVRDGMKDDILAFMHQKISE